MSGTQQVFNGLQLYTLVNGVFKPVSDVDPMPVAGSFTATFNGFAPNGSFLDPALNITTTSASAALPSGSTVIFSNIGTSTAFVKLGIGVTTATIKDIPVPPGTSVPLVRGSNDYFGSITKTGTAILNVNGGSGLFTGGGSSSGGGGGGGGLSTNDGTFAGHAVDASVANIDTDIGTPADAAWSSGNGTVISLLKSVSTKLNSVAVTGSMTGSVTVSSGTVTVSSGAVTVSGTAAVSGPDAAGATASGNPVQAGARAATALPTAVTNGQVVRALADAFGRMITRQFLAGTTVGGTVAITNNSANTVVAAPGAGLFLQVHSIYLTNFSTDDLYLTFNDADGTVIGVAKNAGGSNVTCIPPLTIAVNTALTATCSGTPTAGAVRVTARASKEV